jgi:hypothetical protein
MARPATAIALIPKIKATKAVGKKASVRQRQEPAISQRRTGFIARNEE